MTTKTAVRIFHFRLWTFHVASIAARQIYSKSKSLLTLLDIVNVNDFCLQQVLLWKDATGKNMVHLQTDKFPLLEKNCFSVSQEKGDEWATFMLGKVITVPWAKVDLSGLACGKAGHWKQCSVSKCLSLSMRRSWKAQTSFLRDMCFLSQRVLFSPVSH